VLAEFLGHKLKLLQVFETFRENHVSSSINVGLAPIYCAVDTLDSSGISTGTYYKIPIRTCVTGLSAYLYLLDHVFHSNQRLSIEVTASLGELLVFKVKASGSGLAVLPNSFGTHLTLSKARICVGNKRKST